MTGVALLNDLKRYLDFLSALRPHLAALHTTGESGALGWILDTSSNLCGSLAGSLISGPPFPHQQKELFRSLLRAVSLKRVSFPGFSNPLHLTESAQ